MSLSVSIYLYYVPICVCVHMCVYTVMYHTMTFWLIMDCKYDGGPIKMIMKLKNFYCLVKLWWFQYHSTMHYSHVCGGAGVSKPPVLPVIQKHI